MGAIHSNVVLSVFSSFLKEETPVREWRFRGYIAPYKNCEMPSSKRRCLNVQFATGQVVVYDAEKNPKSMEREP